MTRRSEPTDEQFALSQDILPANGKRGGPWDDHRTTPRGILWIWHTGAQRRGLPERDGTGESVHDRLTRWRSDGTTDRIRRRLHPERHERGRIDHDLWCADATRIRARRAAAGGGGNEVAGAPADHAPGRPRGGFGTGLHLIVDGNGPPPGRW